MEDTFNIHIVTLIMTANDKLTIFSGQTRGSPRTNAASNHCNYQTGAIIFTAVTKLYLINFEF